MYSTISARSSINKTKRRIKRSIPNFGKDWLLIIGCILAPMTSWRVWKIGPGEVFCCLWAVMNIKYILFGLKLDEFVRFWLLFFMSAILGACYGYIFYPDECSFSGLLTWLYLGFIACVVKYRFVECNTEYTDKVILAICIGLSLFQLFLFEYSNHVSTYFYGAQLWYGGHMRYSGGGLNPHQIAMPLAVMAIITLRYVVKYKKIILKAVFVLLSLIDIFLLYQTDSTTGLAALACGLFITFLIFLRRAMKLPTPWVILTILLALFVCVLENKKIYTAFMDWLADDANGMDRLEIFSSFPIAFKKSPIIGLGPGNHARDGRMEFHNSYLEVFAMSGIIGITAYMLFIVRILKKTFSSSPACFGSMIALCVFGCAGFDARRLVYWIVIGLVFCIGSARKEDHSYYIKQGG